MSRKRLTYSNVGVDIDIEAKAAKILYKAAKKTWENRTGKLGEIISPIDDFSGLKYINVSSLPPGTVMYGGSDGVATKSELAERANKFDTLAFDLLAMVCDDAVIRGGEPIAVKSVLSVNTLGKNTKRLSYIEELSRGYVTAAKEAGVAIINGELAQHNSRLGNSGKFSLDWSGDVTWFGNTKRLISGKDIKPGDFIVGLKENGLRSNGISLVRKALEKKYGIKWERKTLYEKKLIDLALTPSRIYSKAIVAMTGGWNMNQKPLAEIHGAAHITGGGIPEKLGRILKPTGLGAEISDPFEPSEIMIECQKIGVTDKEAYKTWNMGQGMLLITPSYENVINVAKDYDTEARIIGKIKKNPGIAIKSRGLSGGTLNY